MNENIIKPNLNTDTDLHYSLLADPSKLKPKEKIINIKQPIDIDNNSILSDFDSEKKVQSVNSSRKSSISSISSKSSKSSKVLSISSNNSNKNKNKFSQPILQQPILQQPILQQPIQQQPIYQPIQEPIPQFQTKEEKPFPSTYIPTSNINDDKQKKFRRMELLAKLYDIEKAGRILTKKYNINSDIEEMEMEVMYQTDLENRKYSINLSKSFLLNAVTAIEFLNSRFDPFGIQLRGWTEQIKTNSDNYDDVFGELYEKYKGPGSKMEPEIKLILMVGASAASFHATKALTKNIGLENIVKNNPDLMSKLQSTISSTIEKNIGAKTEEQMPQMQTQEQIQREMYNKMMEEKEKFNYNQQKQFNPLNTTIKKPNLNNILNKLKSNIPNNIKTKYDETTTDNRIHISDTINSDSSITDIDINTNVQKIRKNRHKIK